MNEEEVIRLAVKTAIDTFEEKREKHTENMKTHLRENTKLLLKNYNMLQQHVDNLVNESVESRPSDLQIMLTELFDRKGLIRLRAITESRERTELMLEHVNVMLTAYRDQCCKNNRQYFHVLYRYYIDGYEMTQIANELSIAERTAWRYLDKALEDLSVLLWGLTGITVNWS